MLKVPVLCDETSLIFYRHRTLRIVGMDRDSAHKGNRLLRGGCLWSSLGCFLSFRYNDGFLLKEFSRLGHGPTYLPQADTSGRILPGIHVGT